MPAEKKLVAVYGQVVETGEDHNVLTEFSATKVKKAKVMGYALKSDEDRADVFAVKGTPEDSIEVEIYRCGPRGTANLKRHYESESLQLIDVVATGTNADGSTFSDNVSMYVDAGNKRDAKLEEIFKKLAELDGKFDEVKALMNEVTELGEEAEVEYDAATEA